MPVIHMVGMTCSPETEERFNKWYNEKHVPGLMKFKGIKRATRYRLVRTAKGAPGVNPSPAGAGQEGYPQYLAIYEFEDRAAFERYEKSPEAAAAREDWSSAKEEIAAEMLWRVQYESIKTWGE